LVLKEKARLLGLANKVVTPQGGRWMMHHLGRNGGVIRRHSVYAALRVVLQHKDEKDKFSSAYLVANERKPPMKT
jgi:hypothetical protein